MVDRQPTNPGRVRLEPVSGQPNIFDMTMADGATEQGTPLNKSTLLKDATAALYGLTNAVPDDVLALLGNYLKNDAVKIETGFYVGTGTYGSRSQNSLEIGFASKMIVIQGTDDLAVIIVPSGRGSSLINVNNCTISVLTASITGNVVKWYSTYTAETQMNVSGQTYHYFAIG